MKMIYNNFDIVFYSIFILGGLCIMICIFLTKKVKNILAKDENFYNEKVFSLEAISTIIQARKKMPNLSKNEKNILLAYILFMIIPIILFIILFLYIFSLYL